MRPYSNSATSNRARLQGIAAVNMPVLSAACTLVGALWLAAGCAGTVTTAHGGGGASGVAGAGAGGASSSTEACVAVDDCTWGEIAREILKKSDCMCLYGCVYLPQTKVTAARRIKQHQALCNPQTDGQGQPCGIDDCAGPGQLACIDGACQAAPLRQ